MRFIASVWVTMSHGALSVNHFGDSPVVNFLISAYNSAFNGVAAVIVFFVVSGICIHIPNIGAIRLNASAFYLRRFIRIGLPLFAVSIVAYYLGESAQAGLRAVVWSVYAEIIYYLIYPLLFRIAKRIGWIYTLCISVTGPIIIVIIFDKEMEISSLGWLSSLWGLPIWISGCLIAETWKRSELPDIRERIWLWRFFAFAYSVVSLVLVFHGPLRIGYPVSMLGFGVFSYFWIRREIGLKWKQSSVFQYFGSASYSLYLVHNIVIFCRIDIVNLVPFACETISRLALIIFATYVTYKFIERPSHLLARRLALTRDLPPGIQSANF